MRISYENYVDNATLQADTEATGYPIENVQDQRLGTLWKSTDGSTQSIIIDLGERKQVDMVALMAHNFTSDSVVTIEGSDSILMNGSAMRWAEPYMVGSALSISNVGTPSLCSLNSSTISFIDSNLGSLRTYSWSGSSFSLVGSTLSLGSIGVPSLAVLTASAIAFIDGTNDELRTYSWSGSVWSMIGSALGISSFVYPSLASLTSSTIALQTSYGTLAVYSWSGSVWSMVGSALAISSAGYPSICALNSNTLVSTDINNKELKTYTWSGSVFSTVGSALAISGEGYPSICSLNSNTVVFIDSINEQLRTYSWSGSVWSLIGNSYSIPSIGDPALVSISGGNVVFIDSSQEFLTTYHVPINPTQTTAETITYNADMMLKFITSAERRYWRLKGNVGTAVPANAWYDICWSPELSLFAAISTSATGTVMLSSDGITWKAVNVAANLYRIAWSSKLGLFCAVGNSLIYTSPDGLVWTSQLVPQNNNWRKVVWSPELEKFCAVSSSGTDRVYGQDTWATTDGWGKYPSDATLDVTSVPGSLHFVSDGTNYNGISRTISGISGKIIAIRYRTNRELLFFNDTVLSIWARLSVSTNFVTAAVLIRADLPVDRIILGWYTSSAGDYFDIDWLWIGDYSILMDNINDGTAATGTFTCDGTNFASGETVICGGKTYTFVTTPASEGHIAIGAAYSNTMDNLNGAINIGGTTASYITATANSLMTAARVSLVDTFTSRHKGILCNKITLSDTCAHADVSGATLSGGTGNDPSGTLTMPGVSRRAMTSLDGIRWVSQYVPEGNTYVGLSWSPELSLFCAVAYSGTNRVMTSPDGIVWTVRSASEASTWNNAIWSPKLGLFAAIADTGTNRVMTSPDGITWTSRAITTATYYYINWLEKLNLFIALGYNAIKTSSDGINWDSRTSPATNIWYGAAWSNELNLAVIVSFDGTNRVATSPDGITWTLQSGANNSAIQLGRLWLGTYITIDPSSLLDFKVSKKRSDIVIYGKDRQKFGVPGVGWRRIELSFPKTANAMIETVRTMIRHVGKSKSMIFLNFDTDRSYRLVEPLYCSITDDTNFTHINRQHYSYSISLEEDC